MSLPTLLEITGRIFETMADFRKQQGCFSLRDVLMSGLAMFSLKFPSLLMFNDKRHDAVVRFNLHELFGVEQAPCDTHKRRVLDEVDPTEFDSVFGALHRHIGKQPVFEHYRFQRDYLLVAIDGVEHFCSNKVSCEHCCRRTLKNGQTQYYHQALTAAIVHPERTQVLPIAVEAILRAVDQSKNTGELKALVRLLKKIREIYPTERIIITLDSLYGKGPCIKLLKRMGFNYIIVIKETDHATLFETIQKKLRAGETTEFEVTTETGELRGYRYLDDVALNKSYPHLKVNYLDYWEISKKGKEYQCLWITDLPLNRESVYPTMRGGRARWKIENETFNTLKNQGYEFEHNYGHGKKHLATVMINLTLLAFLIDQIQELGCSLFQAARHRCGSRRALWEELRGLFRDYFIEGWEVLWLTLAGQHPKNGRLVLDTS